jgi:GntR family phosphonate transport system transcriptional regulator
MRDSFLTGSDRPSPWEPGRAVWRQIEEILVADIAAGIFELGGQMPTEKALAERFGVNRHTIRRALSAVAERGLILTERGRGSFVVRNAIDYVVGPNTRYSENILAQGRQPETEMLGAGELAAGDDVARQLRLRPGSRVFLVTTLRRANGIPIAVGRHFYPAKRVPGFIETFERLQSVSRALTELGVTEFHRAFTRISARLPDAEEARLLRIARAVPVLVSEAVNVEPNGRPIELVYGHFAADRVHFVLQTGAV